MSILRKAATSVSKKKILIVGAFWIAISLVDFAIAYFFGPQIWAISSLLFGTDIKTTFAVLLLFEGAVLSTFGIIWVSGAMESEFDGSNVQTNVYNRRIQMRQRGEQLRQQRETGRVLIVLGVPLLFAGILISIV